MRIVSEAPRERDWLVYHAHSGRPVVVRAPDPDVALYRAHRRTGAQFSGTVRPAAPERVEERVCEVAVCELDAALAHEEALVEEHGQAPVLTEDEVADIVREELWTALLVEHPPTYTRPPGKPRSGAYELDRDA